MEDLIMENLIMDYLAGGAVDDLLEEVAALIASYMWIVVLLSIPVLALAAAYCFFGVKIYRILLVIAGVFGGGFTGSIVLGLMTDSSAGIIIGFLLFGAIFGVLSWYLYKVFLFIQTFFSTFYATFFIMFIITGNPTVGVALGVLAGLVLAIMICIYTKLFVMITTAYRGASSIAGILSLFFITTKAYNIVNFLLLAAFTAAGFYVQNRFFGDTYNGGKPENLMLAKYKLVGIDGMYKGFEFDLEDKITLGRDVDNCNVIFADTCPGVSRIQCEVIYDHRSKSVSIVDRYSSYGTTLNGSKLEINRPMPLNNGDVIMFGENNVFKLTC